ncbi:MAG TPA: hypothetical protein VFH73_08450, partial [Polyangia bacterium]|nr:hypothetical protein [Polyangia bacterium]
MEQVIEVRYAGIVVGQATAVRDRTPTGVFVGVSDPLPVGTILSLKIGDQLTDGRVEQVVESSESSQVGMRVRFVDNRLAAAGAPAAPASTAPVAVPAAPAVVAPAPSAAVRMPPAATRVPPAATPLQAAPSAPEPATSAA